MIEHVAHPDQFLAQAAALVRPGGYVVMTTPNGRYLRNTLPKFSECEDAGRYEAVQFRPNSDGHIFLLHPDEIDGLARRAGLDVDALTLFTNPLTSGHMKSEVVLAVLPAGIVRADRSRITSAAARPAGDLPRSHGGAFPEACPVKRLRVALVADLAEERWPSMDLVAEMLLGQLRGQRFAASLDVQMLRPSLTPRGRGVGRYINRFWDYSRWLRTRANSFDIFHIVDHSYAHLAHVLPATRTVVTCHDADAFMPLVDPSVIPTRLPKVLTRFVLSGMRKAACVTCDTAATRDEVGKYNLVRPDRLVVVPVGVHPALTSTAVPDSDAALEQILGPVRPDVPELLHVGSCIPASASTCCCASWRRSSRSIHA